VTAEQEKESGKDDAAVNMNNSIINAAEILSSQQQQRE